MSTQSNKSEPGHLLPVVETRRSFLEKCMAALAGATIVGIVSPLMQGCEPSTVPTPPSGNTGGTGSSGGSGNEIVFDVSALTADGQVLATTTKGPDGFKIMLVRKSETAYNALSMRCTHQGCDVDDQLVAGKITCFCHGSQFDLDGNVTKSPATAPLRSYGTTYDPNTKKLTVRLQ
jgi:cytochrome b6-f complex iron-sulfur subunit